MQKTFTCPHCEAELQAFELPEAGGWEQKFHLACFNNDCPYYRRGWNWMLEHYNAKVSYRYRLDPVSGKDSPIAVWSETALVDRIVNKEVKPAKAETPSKPVNTAVKPVKTATPKKPVKKAVKHAKKATPKKPAKPVKKKPESKSSRPVKPKRRTK